MTNSQHPRPPEGGEVWHPPTYLDVARFLSWCSHALDKATLRAEQVAQELPLLRKQYRLAYAEAYLTAEGTVEDRRQQAVRASVDALFEMEVCEQRLRAARDQVDTLRTQISTYQSIGTAIRAEASVGTGWAT